MEKTTHKVKVAGATYSIVSDDSPEYMSALAKEVDLKIDALLKNSNMSTTQAAVIAALDYADSFKKSGTSTDNIKAQLKESLKDVAKAKQEADFYKKELERLQGSKIAENEENPALW